MGATQVTTCMDPSKFSGRPGQERALQSSIPWGLLGALIGGALTGTPSGVLTGFLVGASTSFFDWWLHRRLLCLDGDNDHCAVGIVWSLEPPGEKSGFESFDDDYSLNLLLSPAQPGDPISVFPTQGTLVRAQLPITGLSTSPPGATSLGLLTFGYAVTAARLKNDILCPTNPPKTRPNIVSLAYQDDPGELAQLTSTNGWEEFIKDASGNQLPASKGGTAWVLDPDHNSVQDKDRVFPDTQLLHCEFESDAMLNLSRWLPVFMIIGFAVGEALTAGAVGLLPALAPFPAALLILLLIYLAAKFVKDHSHHGNPADASDPGDVRSGDPKKVETVTCDTWDASKDFWGNSKFNLIAVKGRWVYDAGHSRGWNEIHPVRHVQLLTDETHEADRANPSGNASAPSTPVQAIRPKTDSEAAALRDQFCAGVKFAQQPIVKDNQNRSANLYGFHPQLG